MRSARPAALALAVYALISFLYFGLPVLEGHRVVVGSENDPKVFVWMLAWWPHAIVHGENPIVSHAIWAPSGYDLVWTTSIPGLAIAFAPLTWLAGPVASFDTIAILLPALGAWTAFLLCRYLTRAWWPSLVGGYLFGFSSYMLGHEEGHMNLVSVFLVPLAALIVLRFLRGELSGRGLAVRLGVLLAAQVSLSLELFATLTLALAVSALVAFAVDRALRPRLRALVVPVAWAYALGIVVASPLLYYALTDFVSGALGPTGTFVADVTNLVVPTKTIALGGEGSAAISAHYLGGEQEETAYFGAPLLLLILLALLEWRRQARGRFLAIVFGLALLAALGNHLHLEGHGLIPLPWRIVSGLPILDNIYPGRLTMYAWLAASVTVALWTASSRSQLWIRIVVPALIVASLLPNLGAHRWDEKLDVPAFIAKHEYRHCLSPNENVLALPYGYTGGSVLWQALAGFHFRLAGGQVGDQTPTSFGRSRLLRLLLADSGSPAVAPALISFARSKGVGAILVDPSDTTSWSYVLGASGSPIRAGGLLLYPVSKGGVRCNGAPS